MCGELWRMCSLVLECRWERSTLAYLWFPFLSLITSRLTENQQERCHSRPSVDWPHIGHDGTAGRHNRHFDHHCHVAATGHQNRWVHIEFISDFNLHIYAQNITCLFVCDNRSQNYQLHEVTESFWSYCDFYNLWYIFVKNFLIENVLFAGAVRVRRLKSRENICICEASCATRDIFTFICISCDLWLFAHVVDHWASMRKYRGIYRA